MSIFADLHNKPRIDSVREMVYLERNIKQLISDGEIEEIPVEEPKHPMLLGEHWYRDRESGEVYRYIPPEFPARGIWERIQ